MKSHDYCSSPSLTGSYSVLICQEQARVCPDQVSAGIGSRLLLKCPVLHYLFTVSVGKMFNDDQEILRKQIERREKTTQTSDCGGKTATQKSKVSKNDDRAINTLLL